MPSAPGEPDVVRFAGFALHLRSGELERPDGARVLLPDQPFHLLAKLVRQAGVLVTRDDLRRELWADDTFVDFEHSLNAVVKRLREALGDSAAKPRFIETLPRRGYRFMAPVTFEVPSLDGSAGAQTHPRTPAPASPSTSSRAGRLLIPGLIAALAGVLLVALIAGFHRPPRPPVVAPVIAVIPFDNLGSEPDSDLFVDGLSDEVIRNLSVIDGLEVRASGSSFLLKNRPHTLADFGRELGATHVLDGSVARSDGRLRVTTRLVRVSDSSVLWSGRFDREPKEIFDILDEISRSIVNELRLALGQGQRRYRTSVEAYDLFLKARGLQARRAADSRQAVDLYEQVVRMDPGFAPAYAGLATSAAESAYAFPADGGYAVPAAEAEAILKPAALKAMELDPLLAEAHAAMGDVFAIDRQWVRAESSFRHAIELNPSLTTTYTEFVLSVLFPEGKLDEALGVLEAALRVDPMSLDVRRVMAHVQISAGRYDLAIDNCDRVLAMDSTFPYVSLWRARALLHKGDTRQALEWFEGAGRGAEGYRGYAYAVVGRRDEAKALAAKNADYPQRLVMIYAGLGDLDRAFEALARLAAVNPRRAGSYLTRPELAPLRADPRMAALREQLGLPPLPGG